MAKLAKKNEEANKLLSEFKKIDETLANAELVCTKTDGTKSFFASIKIYWKIYNYEITLKEAKNKQTE